MIGCAVVPQAEVAHAVLACPRSVVTNVLDFCVDAVAKVAPVSITGAQKLARLFCRLGLDAPFLDTGHNHIGVE
jgi:hypothetical protein